MAPPEPVPSTLTPRDRTEYVHTLLTRLRAEPAVPDLDDLYHLTSAVVHSWALANTPSGVAAERVTVAVYTHLWRHSSRYSVELARPWRWLQAAFLLALQQQARLGDG